MSTAGADSTASEALRFVERLAPAVRQAAAVARSLEGRVRNRPKHGEPSDVKAALTLADSAAQEAVLGPLLEAFPQVTLEAEEDTPSVARFGGRGRGTVVLDPIDGTLHSYLEGRGPYAVMVGLAVDDQYQAALVSLPREGLFFQAVRGGLATRTRPLGEPRPVRAVASGRQVLVSHGLPEPAADVLRSAGLDPRPACGGAISVAPLIPGVRAGLRIAPEGQSISVRGRIGLLIARAAGARVSDQAGADFPHDLHSPARGLAVVADPGDAEILERALDYICV